MVHPAGEVSWRGADDQLVKLAVGDGMVHGVEGVIPAVRLATSPLAARPTSFNATS